MVVDANGDCQMKCDDGVAAVDGLECLGVVAAFAIILPVPGVAGIGGGDGELGGGGLPEVDGGGGYCFTTTTLQAESLSICTK